MRYTGQGCTEKANRASRIAGPQVYFHGSNTGIILSAVFFAVIASGVAATFAGAQTAIPGGFQPRAVDLEELRATIESLKGKEPLERDLKDYITDKLAAQQLGKALFWDTQVGSDGGACASCHFTAGADIRITNQVNPGLKANDSTFNPRFKGGVSGPNKTFTPADFPFHRLLNPNDRESEVVFDTNDVFSSQGTFGGNFVSNKGGAGLDRDNRASNPLSRILARFELNRDRKPDQQSGLANENCSNPYDPKSNPFHANNLMHRKVEPRQTPSVINAVFNYRQFWDGRANNQFNGVDPFGPRTFQPKILPNGPGNTNAASAGTLVAETSPQGGAPRLKLEKLLIANSSLASQAVGPALSNFEMSCGNKTFANLGRKLLPLRPLARQRVHPEDSAFSRRPGLIAAPSQKGLNTTYKSLVEAAFNKKFWANGERVRITDSGTIVKDDSGFTQMEQNFSLFWGLAVQEYMAILVSDDSPFDRAMNGDLNAMSDRAKAGQTLFLNKGSCAQCHFGPVFSAATFTKGPAPRVLEHMEMGDGYNAFYDGGFYNIGVRPTIEDIGVGGTDPYGFDLSLARSLKWRQLGKPQLAPDKFEPNPCSWLVQFSPCKNIPTWTDPLKSERDNVDGAFKVPSLRNVGLTPPYFHNGGESNLRDVLHFYSRGGNRTGPVENDSTGLDTPNPFGQINHTNLDPDIGVQLTPVPEQHNALLLTEDEIDDLVQFLLSLTDERVACHSGVFDHPELPIYMGQQEVASTSPQIAKDIVRILPAVGQRGLKSIGKPCQPNSGDLFGSVNKDDPTPLQATFDKILGYDNDGRDERNADRLPWVRAGFETASSANASASGGLSASAGSLTSPQLANVSDIFAGGGTSSTTLGALGGTAPADATKAGTAKPVRAARGVTVLAPAVSTPAPPTVPAPVFSAATGDIHGFTTIGFVQDASVSTDINTNCPELPKSQRGGTAVINGLNITIPCNSIVQMPAATFTWADLFDPTKFPSTLTLAANPVSQAAGQFVFPSTEIRIVGNIVGGQHIAGLVYISQESLNSGTGYITGFDYEKGVIYVGRSPGVAPMARLQLNDPKITDPTDPSAGTGRYSAGQTPDGRFSVDQQNPTVHAFSGYPMCIPRTDPFVNPALEADPRCPQINRPLASSGCRSFGDAGMILPAGRFLASPPPGAKYCTGFVMKAPLGTPTSPRVLPQFVARSASEPDAGRQAPLEIGDLIVWAGTLLLGDGQGPNGSDTIAVHTLTANVGIFTQPGTLPSYISIGDFRVGTSPPVLFFKGIVLGEIDRIILEAFTTDLESIVDIYLVDLDPGSGQESQRWITPGIMTGNAGAVGSNGRIIDGGIVSQFFGAQPGRARLRATHPSPGILESPTRYVRVAVRSLCDPANINGKAPMLGSPNANPVDCLKRAPAANGLYSGQYLAPTFNFIFPENIVPGDPTVPNNFWDLGFLVNGEGPNTGSLKPTPW